MYALLGEGLEVGILSTPDPRRTSLGVGYGPPAVADEGASAGFLHTRGFA